jgi:hypothetical protein
MTTTNSVAQLTDAQLIDELQRLATAERQATAALLRALIELDTRRLYLREGCSSLFTYCTQVLHLSEGGAYNRIEAARAARRFPIVLGLLEVGDVTLTAVRLLAPHLTDANHREVLTAARHKGKREVEQLVAALAPRPAAPTIVRRLPAADARPGPMPVTEPSVPVTAPSPVTLDGARVALGVRCATADVSPHSPRASVTPLTPDCYRLQVTISSETHAKLRRVQEMDRHAFPTGDAAAIIDRALTLLLDDLERRRAAATPSPRVPLDARHGSRHIPAGVRRAVWRRDGGQCAFVGARGRCTERGFLEFHHVEPFAAGGAATVENLQLRCRAHNAYEAMLFFGAEAEMAGVL